MTIIRDSVTINHLKRDGVTKMKDPLDKHTEHAKEAAKNGQEAAKRKRGRPSTGLAKTAAERQREHRERMRHSQTGDPQFGGEKEVTVKLSLSGAGALTRLARRNGVTKNQFLDQLLRDFEHASLQGVAAGSAEWNEYFA